jgi:hypothetical protein
LRGEGADEQVGACGAIAPALQFTRDTFLGVVYGLAAEHSPSEREAIETAETMKRVEAAQQVAVSGDVRAHGLIDPVRPRSCEGMPVRPDQPHPCLLRPAPESGTLLRAPGQHETGCIQRRTAVERGIGPVQGKLRGVERHQEAPDDVPLRQCLVVAAPATELPSQGCQRLPLVARQHWDAVEAGNVEERC